MKIAITGKGGVGKTTISSTLACILSQQYNVFAIDADPDMNLASSLGVKDEITPISQMKELIKERTGADVESFGQVFKMNPKISDLPEKLSYDYKNNCAIPNNYNCGGISSDTLISKGFLKLMVMGTIDKGGEGCACPASVLLKALLRHIVVKKEEVVILDMEAGIEHLGRKTVQSVDLMIVAVEPGLKSIETAKRIKKLAKDIGISKVVAILNKCSSKSQENFVIENLKKEEIDLIGSIPFDETVTQSDMEGLPLTEYKSSNALISISKISKNLF